MAFQTEQFFEWNGSLYGYHQVVKVGPAAGGNSPVKFADGSIISMTNAEAKKIFVVE